MCAQIKDEALRERRRRVMGRLFLRLARSFESRAVTRIHELGYTNYRSGDNTVLVHLEMSGNRASELAQRAGVSKQAMSKQIADLEKRGIVTRTKDPRDARAQIVVLTPDGEQMMRDAFEVVFELDEEFGALIGPERMEDWRERMVALLDELDPDGF